MWVTFRAETPIDRLVARPGLRIKVIAAQWSWRFIYSNGVQVADIDTWHPTPAYVPAGTEIEFSGTSEDVIHGFWVPDLHYQRQMLPGYTTHFDLFFDKAGLYPGECSVLCGEHHSEMHFAMEAVSPARSGNGWPAKAQRAREGTSAQTTVRHDDGTIGVSTVAIPSRAPMLRTLASTDHKRIAGSACAIAFVFFLAGGLLAC